MNGPSQPAVATAPWRDDAVLWLLLALLALALPLSGWAWRLERVVYDLSHLLWTRPVPKDIVIVAIDDASVQAIGRWPWPRTVHATLLERLSQARPRAVALDLVLSEPAPDPEHDRWLAQALRRAAPVCVPVLWISGGSPAPAAVLEPVEPLRAEVRIGHAEPTVDADGVMRHSFLYAGPAATPYPHLALALLAAGGEAVHSGVHAEDAPAGDAEPGSWSRSGRFAIRYSGPPGHVRRVSYIDVLRGQVDAGEFAGRYVLVGMTAQGLGDTLATPVNGTQHAMPGVEVHANTLYTLRSGDALLAVPPWQVGVSAAALLALLMAVLRRARARLALAWALGSVPVAVLASMALFGLGVWWNPWAYGLPALTAYPLWSWRRLERAVQALDAEILRLRAEPGLLPAVASALPTAGATAHDGLAQRLQALHDAASTLRAARRFLARALGALPTAMLVDDGAGRVMLANALAARLYEVDSAADLRGLDLARLLGEFGTDPPLSWPDALEEVRGRRGSLSVEASLSGQGEFVVHVACAELHDLPRLIVAIADVAPIKQAEREREEALAFVSHDLRSPLSSILLLTDEAGPLGAEAAHQPWATQVRQLAQRAQHMSDDFVRTAQASRQVLELAPVRVRDLLAGVAEELRPQAVAAGVRLEVSVAPEVLVWALDADLVSRALANLGTNAIRVSPAGEAVSIAAAVADETLVLRVSDRGPGLDAEQRQQLARGDQVMRGGERRGTGLGLLFAQRVARRHQGRLQLAEPTASQGTVFELVLGAAAHASGNP